MTDDPDHQPIQSQYREMLNELARELDARFNPTLPGLGGARGPRKIGFFLTLFEFGDQRRMNYISNAEKVDVKVMLRDIADRIEAREKMDRAGPPVGSA